MYKLSTKAMALLLDATRSKLKEIKNINRVLVGRNFRLQTENRRMKLKILRGVRSTDVTKKSLKQELENQMDVVWRYQQFMKVLRTHYPKVYEEIVVASSPKSHKTKKVWVTE